MAIKPVEQTQWDNVGATPSEAKKIAGHTASDLDKPTADQFNWFWALVWAIQKFVQGFNRWDYIVDSNVNERDFATLAAYIAGTPAAGDKVLVKIDETIAADMIIPDGITLRFLKGKRIITTTDGVKLVFGSDITIEGELKVDFGHSGTTALGVSFNGDRTTIERLNVNNSGSGIITLGVEIQAGKLQNQVKVAVQNSGTITTLFTDSSTNNTNDMSAFDGTTVLRSNGAQKFPNGLDFSLGSDANGDTYQRAAGVLSRLAIGATGTLKQVVAGLVAYVAVKDAIFFGSDANGDIMRRDSGEMQRLGIGDTNQFLGVDTALPEWKSIYVPALLTITKGITTSGGSGVLTDNSADSLDFANLVVNDLVSIPSDSAQGLFPIDALTDSDNVDLADNTNDGKNNFAVSNAAAYTVLRVGDFIKVDDATLDFTSGQTGDKTLSVSGAEAGVPRKIIKVDVINTNVADTLNITYGDATYSDVNSGGGSGGNSFFLVQSGANDITINKTGANGAATFDVYMGVVQEIITA